MIVVKTLQMQKWIPLALITVLCSCEKYSDDSIVPDSKHYSDVERVVDMQGPTDFDWSTEQEIVLTLKSAVSQRVQCVDADGQVIQKWWLTAGQSMQVRLVVPAYQTQLTVEAKSGNYELSLPIANAQLDV